MDTQNQSAYGPLESVNISNNNNNNKRHGYRMIFITIIVLLVAIGGIVISQNEHLQQIIKSSVPQNKTVQTTATNAEPIQTPVTTVADRAVPWLEVVHETGAPEAVVGQPVTLYIKGLSGGKSIIGYDMAIVYDRSMLEMNSISSELADYQLSQYDNTSYISLTGFRSIQKESVVFDNTNIVKIVLTPIKAGTTVISLLPQQGKDKTQMVVDTDVTVLKPQIGSLQLEIR